jgi:hypothetical protein
METSHSSSVVYMHGDIDCEGQTINTEHLTQLCLEVGIPCY